jgi:hypothetical protein
MDSRRRGEARLFSTPILMRDAGAAFLDVARKRAGHIFSGVSRTGASVALQSQRRLTGRPYEGKGKCEGNFKFQI